MPLVGATAYDQIFAVSPTVTRGVPRDPQSGPRLVLCAGHFNGAMGHVMEKLQRIAGVKEVEG